MEIDNGGFILLGSIQLFAVNAKRTHTQIDPVSFIHVIYRVKQTYRKQEVSGVYKCRETEKIYTNVYIYYVE